MTDYKTESLIVSLGRPEKEGEPLNTPIIPASNFILGAGKVYSREDSTDTWNALEVVIGELEGGQAIAYSSGMAAAAAVFEQVPAGGKIAIPNDCYQGVATLASDGAEKGRWELLRVNTDNTDAWVELAGTYDLLWLESPSNPLLVVADLATICATPRKGGGLLAVDNTFATPLNQQPLKLGADISMHSATKYIGGHSDLLGGLLIAGNDELHKRMIRARKIMGAAPGALEMYLAARGVRTMAIRLERCQENAAAIADFLQQHDGAKNVRYPGLATHPQHEIASEQLGGFGGIISFEVNGDGQAAYAVCEATRLVHHATSLGSVETTMERRASHGGQGHLPESLIRISVGIENVDDLCADLDQALNTVLEAC